MEIEAFLQNLAGDPGVAGWQFTQAREALEVYYEQFCGIALLNGGKPESAGKRVCPSQPRVIKT